MRIVWNTAFLVLSLSSNICASEILATITYEVEGSYSTSCTDPMFVIDLEHYGPQVLGDVILRPDPGQRFPWEDGFSGFVDLNEDNNHPPFNNFTRMVERLTDGLDEPMAVDGYVFGCDFPLPTPFDPPQYEAPESYFFGDSIDLVGNDIEFIRLIVNDLSLTADGDETFYDLSAMYEFWGTPIPEPATASFLAFGAFMLMRHKRLCRR